ncbi:alpha/beta hydrolase [Agrilactobacillus yilanensis]|uniref:Alpha/beta hydrolase n=1 Tax=Agrilactobacillus yilanensis TaxID=2485997 RepID=A0ABW4J9I2_9LACO|nr:alpha/beta hydrolase [Agrilactobacillus yilanensis]
MVGLKHKKWLWGLLIVGLVVVVGIFGYHAQQQKILKSKYTFTSTPTIFVHGYRGNLHSEAEMMADIQTAKIGRHQLTVIVDKKGQIHFKGHLNQRMKNPLIAVVFKDNTAGERAYANWLNQIMPLLKRKYQVQNYNAVGHSMGAVAWVLYATAKHDGSQYPKMKKLVTIAGPFAGILGWDDAVNQNYFVKGTREPYYQSALFQQIKRQRYNFPKNVPVLNIYGDLKDGTHSDSTVSVVSATALESLIQQQAQSYTQVEITGRRAQHSALHKHNQKVNRHLINFLWGK